MKLYRTVCFGLFVLAACDGGGSGGKKNADAGSGGDEERLESRLWKGFYGFPELRETCTAAWAQTPSDHYSNLSFIPCSSGAPDCEQLRWDGVVRWDPIGSGDMLKFYPQIAVDASGNASKLLALRRYPRGTGHESGLPFEAVVYNLNNGAPLIGLRNLGARDPEGSSGYLREVDCIIEATIASKGLWIVGNPAGRSEMLAGYVPFGSAPTLRPVEASRDVIQAGFVASDEVLGMEEKDGKLIRVGVDPELDLSLYGPNLRVWPHSAQGKDILTYNDKGDSPRHFILNGAGEFKELPARGLLTRSDGVRIAWVEETADGLDIWTADSSEDEGTMVASLQANAPVLAASVANGTLGLVAHDSSRGPTGYLVNLTSGKIAQRSLDGFGRDGHYVGHDGRYMYVVLNTIDSSDLARYKMR